MGAFQGEGLGEKIIIMNKNEGTQVRLTLTTALFEIVSEQRPQIYFELF